MGTHPIFESDFDCLTEMTRGTESGDQRNVASAVNPGGSWKSGDDAARTQGHIAFGPCEDPIKQEARDANFADIVTLPILPEPQQNPITAGMQMWRSGVLRVRTQGSNSRILAMDKSNKLQWREMVPRDSPTSSRRLGMPDQRSSVHLRSRDAVQKGQRSRPNGPSSFGRPSSILLERARFTLG